MAFTPTTKQDAMLKDEAKHGLDDVKQQGIEDFQAGKTAKPQSSAQAYDTDIGREDFESYNKKLAWDKEFHNKKLAWDKKWPKNTWDDHINKTYGHLNSGQIYQILDDLYQKKGINPDNFDGDGDGWHLHNLFRGDYEDAGNLDPYDEDIRTIKDLHWLREEKLDEEALQEREERRRTALENTRKNPQATIDKINALTDDEIEDHYNVSSDRYKDENGVRPHGYLPLAAWNYLVQDYGLEPGTEPYRVAKERYKKWWNDAGYDIDEWNHVTKR